jgi:hypothetical protein
VFEVNIFVSSIMNFQDGCTLLSEFNDGEYEVGLIEVEGREACGGDDFNFKVASGDIYFCLVYEKL